MPLLFDLMSQLAVNPKYKKLPKKSEATLSTNS